MRRVATSVKSPKKRASSVKRKKKSKRTPRRSVSGARPKPKSKPGLQKHEANPLLRPNPEREWESKAVFNPAAISEGGRVHLAYRAIGETDRSVLGYASSRDGFDFEERLDEPMYVPRETFEGSLQAVRHASPGVYMSGGGGWGGCEDPRLTRIDDRVYLTYVAYDGWNPPRVALSSISLEDFLTRNWNWDRPVLISPPGVVDKNACLFPEKIRGKYVMIHRIFPDILIDYLDDLNFDGRSRWLRGEFRIMPTKTGWDSRKVGAGAPPIKTDHGWLLIYQAVGEADPGRYKIGAMLLDLERPEKVLARSKEPLLEPDEWYENSGWKAGVAYPCGAVVKDGQLVVYYGGADTYVCAASAPLDDFVRRLMKDGRPKLTARPLRNLGKRRTYARR